MVNQIFNCLVLATAMLASGATAFTAPSRAYLPSAIVPSSSSTAIHAAAADAVSSRRDLLARTGSAIATVAGVVAVSSPSSPAHAAASADPPTPEEIDRIKTGYKNIQYLLANWEKETTVCRENGGECKRDADACRRYLGLRSTTDPLFQIEKVFAKVKYMDDIDPEKLESFFEATEDW
jgi:hypothetical protein